jgi:DNA-binding transcriptional ArsR family regulator
VDIFEAIADPTRRHIIELVSVAELSAGDIAREFEVTRPAVSRHLRVLRDAGAVRSRVQAQRRLYRVDPAAFDELDGWITKTRRFWSERFDALDRHVEGATDGR